MSSSTFFLLALLSPGPSCCPAAPSAALSLLWPLLCSLLQAQLGQGSGGLGVMRGGHIREPPSASQQLHTGRERAQLPVPALQSQHRLLPKILPKTQQDFLTAWFGPWQRSWRLDP